MKYAWLLIVAVGALAYSDSLDNGFHYDDEHSVQQNINIQKLKNIPRFFVDPGMFSVDPGKRMYRPLLLVSYALNYALGGYHVRGYHVVNLLLHVLCALAVCALGKRLSERADVGLAAGLLFVLHPLATEPVNYISSRSESLAALFYLLGLALYLRAAVDGRLGARLLALLCMALGLLSKATVITLPAVLLLYDFLFRLRGRGLRSQIPRLLREHAPFWLLALGYLGVIWGNGYLSGSLHAPVRTMGEQFLTQSKAVIYYLRLLILPWPLNVEHQFGEQTRIDATVAAAWLLLATVLLWLKSTYARRRRMSVFLTGLAGLALLPVLIMPLNVMVNERRLYLPLAAMCIGLALVVRAPRMRRPLVGRVDRGAAILLALLAVFGGLTMERNRDWRDEFSLWGDAVRKAPLMPRVHLYLGNAYKSAAMVTPDARVARIQWERARAEYERTIVLDPHGLLGLRGLNNVGAVSFMLRDMDRAEAAYRRAVEMDPRFADAIVNLGSIYHDRARRRQTHDSRWRELMETAARYYIRALRIQPNHPLAHANLGLVYADLGKLERSRQEYERAYRITPSDPRLLNNMGNLFLRLAQAGRPGTERVYLHRAHALFAAAARLNPGYAAPRRGLRRAAALLDSAR